MADIRMQMAARLKRTGSVKVYVQANRYYGGETDGDRQAISQVRSIAGMAGVPVDVTVQDGEDGRRFALGVLSK